MTTLSVIIASIVCPIFPQFKGFVMRKVFVGLCLGVLFSVAAFTQVRPVGDDEAATPRAAAPASFQARYEGGMFGYNEREKGNLKFDDANERLVFFGKDGKEKFSVPYSAMLVVSPSSRSVASTTGTIVSAIPVPGAGLAGLLREKRRYLIIQFADQDADVRGTVSFRVENKETLDSVVPAIGEKAKLTPRGDAFYRPRSKTTI